MQPCILSKAIQRTKQPCIVQSNTTVFFMPNITNKAVEDFFPNMPQTVFTAIIRYIVITHYSLGSNYSGTQDSKNRLQELFGHSIYENIQVEQTQHVSPKEMGTLTKTACYFFQGTQWDFLQDF